MANLNLKGLVRRLNLPCQQKLQAAAGLCLWRTNYNVEIEHWLAKLSEGADTDLHLIYRFFEVDVSRLQKQLTAALDRLKTGNSRTPALSPHVVALAQEGWLLASVEYGASQTRSAHLLAALLLSEELGPAVRDAVPELEKISPEALKKDLPTIVQQGPEAAESSTAPEASPAAQEPGSLPGGAGAPALQQFTIDLTQRAKGGKIDPVLGRDAEVRQIVDILMRRRQNNPILTGEAGVGKTAVAEGLANRIAAGDVPPPLRDVRLLTLDLGLLQAGAGLKGEFENRLNSVINEVRSSPVPIILFIDEAHNLIGAGGQSGPGDAASLLKPALARGELRTIAATTWAEYKRYFEKDAALARRFQVVKIEEPSEASAIAMLRGLVGAMETHHKVRVLDNAVSDAVRLSHRYITGRQLPDKAVAVLDTACARVAIGHSGIPAPIEDCRRRIEGLGLALDILRREQATGDDHSQKVAELNQDKAKAEAELAGLETRWKREGEMVAQLRSLRTELEQSAAAAASNPDKLRKLHDLTADLQMLQGEQPLVNVCVDAAAVAAVIAGQTGIPVGRMMQDEIRGVLDLQKRIEERVIGQSHALKAISQAIVTSRARIADPRKPIGVFLMVGTSGVGKTETAGALADLLYGGDQNMTVINMSEFKEEHKVSLLMGSPPGYVGYGEGGVLTEAVRRKPYSVLLLDEMEKAHPGVQDVFYQVFDKGMMRDGEGRDIDFKNTLIIMTSNAASDLIAALCADPDTTPDAAALAEAVYPELLKTFKPAFLGRCTIVAYFPLPRDILKQIIGLKLMSISRRLADSYRASFSWSPAVLERIADRCTEASIGARNIDNILTKTVLPELSAQILERMAEGKSVRRVSVDSNGDANFIYQIE
jgi:type VI secretion system protein VasG